MPPKVSYPGPRSAPAGSGMLNPAIKWPMWIKPVASPATAQSSAVNHPQSVTTTQGQTVARSTTTVGSTRQATQSQSLSFARQIASSRSAAQGQSAALPRVIGHTLSVGQDTSATRTQGVVHTRTVASSQSEVATLSRGVASAHLVGQSNPLTIAQGLTHSVSTTQPLVVTRATSTTTTVHPSASTSASVTGIPSINRVLTYTQAQSIVRQVSIGASRAAAQSTTATRSTLVAHGIQAVQTTTSIVACNITHGAQTPQSTTIVSGSQSLNLNTLSTTQSQLAGHTQTTNVIQSVATLSTATTTRSVSTTRAVTTGVLVQTPRATNVGLATSQSQTSTSSGLLVPAGHTLSVAQGQTAVLPSTSIDHRVLATPSASLTLGRSTSHTNTLSPGTIASVSERAGADTILVIPPGLMVLTGTVPVLGYFPYQQIQLDGASGGGSGGGHAHWAPQLQGRSLTLHIPAGRSELWMPTPEVFVIEEAEPLIIEEAGPPRYSYHDEAEEEEILVYALHRFELLAA